ncbi:MAG TPA: phosphoadenosine phosphosulfate reductase family protein [Sedimentibacter sp.]|nr:phosphoadenosine phosphosulfate reductase family protein [Sedimentibacter sp.]
MENKHTQYDLKQMQSLSLESKIRMTQQRIRQWYDEFDGMVYVSRSGGKDSDVLGHIVKEMYPDVPHVFINTGLEHDSVMKHGICVSDEVIRPIMRFDDVILKYGYPIISKEVSEAVYGARRGWKSMADKFDRKEFGTIKYKFLLDAPFNMSHMCCNVMKKKPCKNYEHETTNKPIIGTMADESMLRKSEWIKNGCNSFDNKRQISKPLSFWTEQDILHYIKLYKIEIASAYGDIVYTDEDGMQYDNDFFNVGMKLITTGESRTGCAFCMFGITHDTERFVRLKEREPKKYDYVMRGGKFDEQGMWIPHNGLGYKFIIDWLNEHGGFNIKY